MTITKAITRSSFQGLLTGTLLAATTLVWLNSSNPYYLPALVTLWWLIVFGSNLYHAYALSNYRFTDGKRFGIQMVHAAITALAYWGIDIYYSTTEKVELAATNTNKILQASIPSNVETLLTDTMVVVPAAFILSLVTSGLLFSILTHPSGKN